MSYDHLSYLLVLILAITCQSLQSSPIRSVQSGESFIKNNEEFIPTNEWQIVKEGQAIPPGLHIRLNLQTGLREAKLLEGTEQKSSSNDLVPVSNDSEDQEIISKQRLERAFAHLDLSKDDVITDQRHEEEVKTKFRSYDELKKDFESMNMKIQTDYEILTDLIKRLRKSEDEENRKTILTDLEFYLHQYDNAILFADLNGLEIFMELLNSTSTSQDVRYLTSLAAGAAFQGNPKVQLKGLNLGFVQYLLRLLNTERDHKMQTRLLFTLSTLLRNYPPAQLNFLEHGGIETIIKIFDQSKSTPKLTMRTIEFLNDLIVENVSEAIDENRQIYEKIDIRDQLLKHGWCSRLPAHLSTIDPNEMEQIEKLLRAMILLTDVCRTDFVSSSLTILDELHDIYSKRHLSDDSTHHDLLLHLENLRRHFQQTVSNDL